MSITGQRIKDRRKQLDMSADDVASQLGVSRSTIFRYENGHIEKVPANVLEKLAEILKTTPAYLMGWEDDYTDYNNLYIDVPAWQRGSYKVEDGIMIRETADGNYRTDERLGTIGQRALPDDRDKIADMAEVYLTLTDLGKRKAYDYVIDLSEQSKYRKRPDRLNPQAGHEGTDIEVSDEMK
ncbi:helix-turn-helix domain-containing protein [Clostridium sp. Marseille-P2415]|uniref:helix-turn-helix domain-containing protein n=1 Tax=Clostridium sp. Marseille-P2415 TaxID=1805471 RepID=UPI00098831E6|nr:helix-turn-helix transcriptional regulator [Clostridium sp. Marseille-P2415]